MNLDKLTAILFLLALAGCAAPPAPQLPQADRSQTITVDTPGVEGATCIIQNGSGVWNVPAPGPVTLPRAPYPLDINCFKGEHLRGRARVVASFAPAEAGAGESCVSCRYPGIVTIPLTLNDSLMAVPVLRQGP